MRFVWMFFLGLIVVMVVVLPRLNRSAAPSLAPSMRLASDSTGSSKRPVEYPSSVVVLRNNSTTGPAALADSVVAFGLAQRGTPYLYAGVSPLTGFDCSGFIMYTFAHFNVAVPHSTALLIDVGQPVARADAQPGDIVVFTGTATSSSTPGHAGIVVSDRGEVPLRFVHSSSARRESGVKVSHIEGTDYERRFMQVRRVLGVNTLAETKVKVKIKTHPVAPDVPAELPVRSVAVKPALVPLTLPKTLATKKLATLRAPQKKKVKPKAKSSSAVPRPTLPTRAKPKAPIRAGQHR